MSQLCDPCANAGIEAELPCIIHREQGAAVPRPPTRVPRAAAQPVAETLPEPVPMPALEYWTDTANKPATNGHKPWPILGDEAWHGPAAECVAALAPYTEADPVAMLVTTLVRFAAEVGTTPTTATVPSAKQHARVGAVIVGETSKGAKGTSWDAVEAVFTEGLDEHVIYVPGSGEMLVDQMSELGRAVMFLPEMRRLLTVVDRAGSTLGQVLQQAWDKGRMDARSRGNPKAYTEHAHLCMLGHITPADLSTIDGTWMANGLANRWLFCLSRSPRDLPFADTTGLPVDAAARRALHRAIREARKVSEIQWSPDARDLWCSIYPDLKNITGPKAQTDILERCRPYVIRLALVYALADCSRVIEAWHLLAALAVWRYSEASVRYLFGPDGWLSHHKADIAAAGSYHQLAQDVDRLTAALVQSGALTLNQQREVFNQNRSAVHMSKLRGELIKAGLAEISMQKVKQGAVVVDKEFLVPTHRLTEQHSA